MNTAYTESKIHVFPTEGMTIFDPETMTPLPPEGKVVSNSVYWRRREGDGDITVVEPD